jgi:hypothetical protein
MTTPITPKLLKGGIVLLDPTTGATLRTIALQYNPDTLTRTLQVQAAGGEGGDRLEALRLKGPPNETIKLDAEIDATDQLEFPNIGRNRPAVELGIHPQLAALEMLIHPTAESLRKANELARSGTLEIAPAETWLTLFVWSRNRIVPVRFVEFSVTEEGFDTALNPIRAKVSLGMRVLSVADLGFEHKGGSLFMSYLENKEQLAVRSASAPLSTLGITGIP